MGFREHRPGPPLGDYVDYLWSFEQNAAPDHPRERVLPTCTVELVVNACEAEGEARIYDSIAGERWLRGGAVAGCYTRAFEFDTRARIRTVGAHFKPGGAARLLGAPAGALANSHVELTDLWGPSATELHERLCAATTFHQQMHLLEKALIARLPDRPHHRPAVAVALAQLDQPGMEVGRVATVLGLSRRRLIEIFSEDVGMTPKRYAMVRRFQRALDLATRSPAATTVYGVTAQRLWATIAGGVAVVSVITGGVALTRRATRLAVVAMIAGLIVAINGGLVLAVANGGPGSGNGVVGGAAALVLGMAAVALGGLALSRARTVGSARSA
jgi:AraC-like DNA-binding protein